MYARGLQHLFLIAHVKERAYTICWLGNLNGGAMLPERVKAVDFIRSFKAAYPKNPVLTGKNRLTFFMVGNKDTGNDGFLGGLAKSFNLDVCRELNLDHNWWCYYDTNTGKKLRPVGNNTNTPWRYMVAIEHENEPANLPSYVRKLMHVNVPLKILITYPFEKDAPGRKYTRNTCRQQAVGILLNEATDLECNEYLLCFGPERDDPSINAWEFWSFDRISRAFSELT